MKICVFTHTFPKHRQDTTAAFMHPLVLGLIRAGNDVVVLAPYHKDFIPKDFPYRIITYRYIWPMFLHKLGFSQTLKDGMKLGWEVYLLAPFLYFFGTLALWRVVRREHFDVISSHWILPNGFMACVATLGTTTPYVVSLPGSDVYVAQKNWLFAKMAYYAAFFSERVCADSPQYVAQLRNVCPVTVPTDIIAYPVNTDVIKPLKKGVSDLRRKLGATKKTMLILGVGRMVYKKGFNYLIEAVAVAYRSYTSLRLILIGEGDQMTEWHVLAKRLGIGDIVHFAGSVTRNEINHYYNACDIFVMPSVVDQFGNIDDRPVALLEAMACGVSVIATNFPGNALTIENGVSGILVPEKNVDAIATAVAALLRSATLRNRLGREARRRVYQMFRHTVIGKRYDTLFRDILRHRNV